MSKNGMKEAERIAVLKAAEQGNAIPAIHARIEALKHQQVQEKQLIQHLMQQVREKETTVIAAAGAIAAFQGLLEELEA